MARIPRRLVWPLIAVAMVTGLSLVGGCAAVRRQGFDTFTTATPVPPDSWLVIGFLGGFESWDSQVRSVRRLALDLRAKQIPGVRVETVENHRRELAMQFVAKALDRNGDGKLDKGECAAARIILYGQSFGGAAVVKFARELKARGISVALTIQIDSFGGRDNVIPSNVARAVNYYQRNSIFVEGRPIRAEDPAKTEILGNFRVDMEGKKSEVPHPGVTRLESFFGGAHTKLAFDHEVWQQVESYITGEIGRANTSATSRGGN